MGRRSTLGMVRARVGARGFRRVRVVVLHPDNGTARPCTIRFCARGVVLESAAVRGRVTLLRVPWWAVEGFSADHTVRVPDGGAVQALDLLTDRGRLRLALPAADVAIVLSMLSAQARRWRRWQRPAARRLGRFTTVALRAGREALARAERSVRASRRRPALAFAMVVVALSVAVSAAGALTASLSGAPRVASASVAGAGPVADASGIAGLVAHAHLGGLNAARLPRASAPPPPAPPSIADAPALSPHEVFGFVPYWSLGDEPSFDVSGFTTLAYFAVSVNADGTLNETGTGWGGYESQAFADLVARAHAAGARVVLTVNCFSLPALEALTSSHSAASVLAASVVKAIDLKHLDGVNIDFEGGGPAQRPGLTALVATVAAAVHAADPHFQVTVDTFGDAAGDPGTFYDVRALASVSDGLFVMAYGLNYGALPSPSSPITSNEMSDLAEAAQYASAVPPSKVIFGTSFFGYSWATTNGTMSAHAIATGTPITYAQMVASGHPIYWDPVTQTAWTSYESGGQWYEDYVGNPASVYLVAMLAQRDGFAGVGAWALGMDGNDPQMTAALDGKAPPQRAGPAGPAWTPPSRPNRKELPVPHTVATLPRTPTTTTTTSTTTSRPSPVTTTIAPSPTSTTTAPSPTSTTTIAPSPTSTTTIDAPPSATTTPPGTNTTSTPGPSTSPPTAAGAAVSTPPG